MNAETGEFDLEITDALGLPRRLFPKLRQPGTEIGTYKGSGSFVALPESEELVKEGMLFDFTDGTFSVKDKEQYTKDLIKAHLAEETDEDITYYDAKLTATTTDGTELSTVRYV